MIVPIEVSARHVHLSKDDLSILFGPGYELSVLKRISQVGQFAAHENVVLQNGDKKIFNVRIVGPARQETQVELSPGDARRLGINAPIKRSGNMEEAAMLTIIGPRGAIVRNCAIIAQRHIHASPEDIKEYNLYDGQIVSVQCGTEREVIFLNVIVRIDPKYFWNFHIDIDEANAANVKNGDTGTIIV